MSKVIHFSIANNLLCFAKHSSPSRLAVDEIAVMVIGAHGAIIASKKTISVYSGEREVMTAKWRNGKHLCGN